MSFPASLGISWTQVRLSGPDVSERLKESDWDWPLTHTQVQALAKLLVPFRTLPFLSLGFLAPKGNDDFYLAVYGLNASYENNEKTTKNS